MGLRLAKLIWPVVILLALVVLGLVVLGCGGGGDDKTYQGDG